jgi:hypothetical protein
LLAVVHALAAATGHWASTAAAAIALITFAVIYTRVSKPVNTADRSGGRRPSAGRRP